MVEDIFYWYGLVVGSLVGGALIGLIPLLAGLKVEKKKLAVAGFVSCIVGSFILGLYLSLPCCIGFTVAILVLRKKREPEAIDSRVNAPGQSFAGQSWTGDMRHEGCPWYQPGSAGNPPGCRWHGADGPFSGQNRQSPGSQNM